MAERGCEPWQWDRLTQEHCSSTGLHPGVRPEGGGGGGGGGGESSRLEEQVKGLCGREEGDGGAIGCSDG